MSNPIVSKDTLAVNSVGPNGVSAAIDIAGANHITLINDGPGDINFFYNQGVQAVGADGFRMKITEVTVDYQKGLENFFVICGGGDTASVRYIARKLPTIRGHI